MQAFPISLEKGITSASLSEFLKQQMPGDWNESQIQHIWKNFPGQLGYNKYCQQSELREFRVPEVLPLLAAVRWDLAGKVFDPWGMGMGLRKAFGLVGKTVVTNGLIKNSEADFKMYPTDQLLYTTAAKQSIGAIVMAPWPALLDVAIPLAVASSPLVCVKVPGSYPTQPSAARATWLRNLQADGRIHVVFGVPTGAKCTVCVWLLIFKDQQHKDDLLQTEFCSGPEVSFVHKLPDPIELGRSVGLARRETESTSAENVHNDHHVPCEKLSDFSAAHNAKSRDIGLLEAL